MEAKRQSHNLSRFNAGLIMAVGMDLHALGFMLTFGGRIHEILFLGADFDTTSPFYWFGTVMIFTAKTLFVWLAALGEGRSYSKPFIWSYWAALAAWAAFSTWWYL